MPRRSLFEKAYGLIVFLGNDKLRLGKRRAQSLRQGGNHRVFRAEVVAVDQIHAQLPRLQEDAVFHVRSHEGVAAGLPGADKIAPARAAEHGDMLHRPPGVVKAQPVRAEPFPAERKKGAHRHRRADTGGRCSTEPQFDESSALRSLLIHVEADAVVAESAAGGTEPAYLQTMAERALSERIRQVLRLSKQWQADFLGLAGKLYLEPTAFAARWPSLPLTVSVSVRLSGTGDVEGAP